MPLTEQQHDLAHQWLSAKNALGPCHCGANSWSLLDELGMAPTLDVAGQQGLQGTIFLFVRCDDCSRTISFHAHRMGLL